MLHSQLDILIEPEKDEAIIVDRTQSQADIVNFILSSLND